MVKYHLEFYEVQTGEPALVKTAANIFREMCYNYRDSLTAGIIVAGWDHKLGGKKKCGVAVRRRQPGRIDWTCRKRKRRGTVVEGLCNAVWRFLE